MYRTLILIRLLAVSQLFFCLFKEIRHKSSDYPHRVAKYPENRNRNRYRDVSPCEYLFCNHCSRLTWPSLTLWTLNNKIFGIINHGHCKFCILFISVGMYPVINVGVLVTHTQMCITGGRKVCRLNSLCWMVNERWLQIIGISV